MITFVMLLLFAIFTSVYPVRILHDLKAVTLTPTNTNESGANIRVLHPDVTTTSDQWSVVTSNQVGFQLHVSLDDTWGFIDDHYSKLHIIFENNNKDEMFNHSQLLITFSVDSQYVAAILNPVHSNQKHQIFPNCLTPVGVGNVEYLVNTSHNNQSRIQKVTKTDNYTTSWPALTAHPTAPAMTYYNTSWPLLFFIQYLPEQLMVVDLMNHEFRDSHLHCQYNDVFALNHGLDIYIGAANNGDAFNISQIYLEYQFDNATREPTSMSPTVTSINPTNAATLNPTVSTTNPTSTTLNPTDSTTNPTSATLNPTVSTTNPTNTVTLNPTVSTANPTSATLNPTVSTTNPTNTPIDSTTSATVDPTTATTHDRTTIDGSTTSTTSANPTTTFIDSSTTSIDSTTTTSIQTTSFKPITTAASDRVTTDFFTSSISSTVTDIDANQYSLNCVFLFQYEFDDNSTHGFGANITDIIAAIISDVIEDEVRDDCADGSYHIRVDQNISTVFVNASIFACDETAQNRLYAYVSDNTLQADVITIMNDDLDIIIAPGDFAVLSVDKITRHSDIVESTEIADEAISTTEYAKKMNIYKQSDVLVLMALVGILCVAIVLILIDVLCICRLDRFHVIHILVLALTICNLLTDVVVSYRLYVHYVKVNDGVLVLILLVCTNLCIAIPYLYHIIFGTRTLYAIPSHLCCLFSNLLLIISGDLYATCNVVSIFDAQTAPIISIIRIQNKAKITIILCHLSQIIIQSIFVIHVLRYSDAFIIVSIVFSFATLIPYCVHKNTELAPLVTKHNTLKIDVLRSVVTDETYTSVNTPSRPRDDVSDVHHANEDEETDEDLYVSKHTSTPRARGTPGSETVYTAIKFDDLDVEHSSLPRLPDEHVSVSANVNGIMVTNKGAEKEIEGQQQTTGTRNEEDGDEVKENVLLDAILSEVLEKQELDPNKIHEMNANEMDHNSNKSISNDSDKIYDRYP